MPIWRIKTNDSDSQVTINTEQVKTYYVDSSDDDSENELFDESTEFVNEERPFQGRAETNETLDSEDEEEDMYEYDVEEDEEFDSSDEQPFQGCANDEINNEFSDAGAYANNCDEDGVLIGYTERKVQDGSFFDYDYLSSSDNLPYSVTEFVEGTLIEHSERKVQDGVDHVYIFQKHSGEMYSFNIYVIAI